MRNPSPLQSVDDVGIHASIARARAIVASELECVNLVAPDGTLLHANPAALRLLEAESADSILGASIVPLVHEEDRPAFLAHFERVSAGAVESLRFRVVGLRGTERWLESYSSPADDADGEVTGILCVARDITEQVDIEKALVESRRRLETLMNHLPGVAYRCRNDEFWTMEVVSEGSIELTGYSPSDLINNHTLSFSDLIHPDDRDLVSREVQDALIEKRPFRIVYRMRHRDGSERWAWEQGQVVGVAEDGMEMIEGFVADITDRKKLERQLLESQKMESVGRLAGGIAHDFNNLLLVILGTAELALGSIEQESSIRDDLLDILGAGEHAATLTKQLLAFSRRQVMQPRLVNLNTLVSETLNMLRRLIGEEIRVVIRPAPRLRQVRVDPGQIEQVLTNLVLNARDAMKGGGTLTIETRNLTPEEAVKEHPTSAGENPASETGGVLLVVRDTGCGMDEETVERVFEPFFTTKPVGVGTGLGLSTAYGIVQQSGGWIDATSRPGAGATFRVFLPGVEDAEPVETSSTVLIVEDDEAVARIAERILKRAGYLVSRAATGRQALELIGGRREAPKLLMTDVVLPGMNGLQLARRVVERHPDTKVIFTSGYTDDFDGTREFDDGTSRFLPKPYTPETLLDMVRELLV